MAHKATVTAVVGPGRSITSAILNNLTELHLFPDRKILQVGSGSGLIDIDLNGVTTFTVSITSGQYSLTLS